MQRKLEKRQRQLQEELQSLEEEERQSKSSTSRSDVRKVVAQEQGSSNEVSFGMSMSPLVVMVQVNYVLPPMNHHIH